MTKRLKIDHALGEWVRLVRPGRRDGETGIVSAIHARAGYVHYGVTWWDCSESFHRADELAAAWPSADPGQ